CRWRHSLAGQTVVVHDHLDGTVTICYGPHLVGRFDGNGAALRAATRQQRGGKGGSVEDGGNQKTVPTVSPTPLEISPTARDSHFPTAPATGSVTKPKLKTKAAHAA
ncbi:MAG: hypothetical protein LAP39_22840, partial [Acidobacteriia bacterium]|nr:hypothetical protein [Terriglobia bacterium]